MERRPDCRFRWASAALIAALSACDGATAPKPDGSVIAVGRLERGAVIELRVVRGTDTAVVHQSAVTFTPAAAAEASFSGNGFVLKAAGPITASVVLANGSTATASFDVARPPSILFDMSVAGNRDIYRMDLDGGDLVRLTTDAGADLEPTAAKGLLVFSSFRAGNGELYSKALATVGGEIRLTTTVANELSPRLSPDAQALAYVRDDGSAMRVWLARADATQGAALTGAFGFGGATEGSPAWRFSSDSIALMSTATGAPRIYLAGASAGATPAPLIEVSGSDSVFVEPTWSADGKFVAFTAAGAGGKSRVILVRRADGVQTVISPAEVNSGQPVFLVDGRLVYTVFGTANASSLVWVDLATPDVSHPIPVTGAMPQHPAIIWP